MNTSIVVACFGDAKSTATIAELSAQTAVVAVAFDFGGAVSLSDMHDVALAAGAKKCHALDVREEFARELVHTALQPDMRLVPEDLHAELALRFISRKLHEIAALEHASCVPPDRVHLPARRPATPAVIPTHVHIRFDNGVPVAINGVDMSLAELMDSLETITGESALTVLHQHITRSPDLQIA